MGPRVYDPTFAAVELRRQAHVGSNPDALWQQFRDETAALHGLRLFGFMRAGSTIIQLVSSMATYSDYGGAPELNGKIIGFMGDRHMMGGTVVNPPAVIIPPVAAWKWRTVTG